MGNPMGNPMAILSLPASAQAPIEGDWLNLSPDKRPLDCPDKPDYRHTPHRFSASKSD